MFHSDRRLKTLIRHLVTVLPILISLAGYARAEDGAQWSGDSFDSMICDGPECDSSSWFLDSYRRNQPRCRGTVGTLFRWSSAPAAGEISQLDEPLVTDRPDFTEASSVVGLGVLQLETGYTYTYDDDGTDRTISHSYPETLFRYGVLANWLELRLAWNYGNEDINGVSSAASDDLYLGLKIGLTPQLGCRPEMALIPQMFIPLEDEAGSDERVLPGLNWIYAWALSDCLSTAGSTQFNKVVDEVTDQSYTEWAQSWTFAYSLTDRLGAYTEYFGLYPSGADTASTQHFFNGGFTVLLTNDLQWDIRSGVGLNDEADDYFAGTGLAIRFR